MSNNRGRVTHCGHLRCVERHITTTHSTRLAVHRCAASNCFLFVSHIRLSSGDCGGINLRCTWAFLADYRSFYGRRNSGNIRQFDCRNTFTARVMTATKYDAMPWYDNAVFNRGYGFSFGQRGFDQGSDTAVSGAWFWLSAVRRCTCLFREAEVSVGANLFITFEILQGRSRSHAPSAPADARSVSDSWLSCFFTFDWAIWVESGLNLGLCMTDYIDLPAT